MRGKRSRMRGMAVAVAVVMGVAATTLSATSRGPWILWNTSPSVPEGLYLRTNDPMRVSAIVAACLPEEIATTAKARGYLRPGSRCPGGVAPLLKRVAAVEGAWVELVDGALRIDGAPWPRGLVEQEDSQGLPVPWRLAFPFEVKAGEVLLLGEHTGSFDGRYFGPVAVGAVMGVYEPALIPSPSPAGGRREPETALKAVSALGAVGVPGTKGDACVAPTPGGWGGGLP